MLTSVDEGISWDDERIMSRADSGESSDADNEKKSRHGFDAIIYH